MRSLAVLDHMPFPATNGVTYPIAAQLSELARLGRVDLVTTAKRASFGEDTAVFQKVYPIQTLAQPGSMYRYVREAFFGEAYFTRPYPRWQELPPDILDANYDYVYFSPAWSAEWAKSAKHLWKGAKRILCLNDCISERFVRDLDLARRNILPAKMRLYHLIRGSRLPWIKRVEKRLLAEFDYVLVQSERDRASVSRVCGEAVSKRISVIPNGSKLELLDLEFAPPAQPTLVHLGGLTGNRGELVFWFIDQVFSRVRESIPNLQLRLCGKVPDFARARLKNVPGIDVVGYVDHVREAFENTSVSIAPLLMRTGLMNKVTDSLASGVPCIGMGAFGGIPNFQNGFHGYEVTSAKEWCKVLVELLGDKEQMHSISKQGRELILKELTWEQSIAKFRAAIQLD